MRNRPDAIMIFAAGFGTRMGDLTLARPKPLIEVAGRPLIDHALKLVHQAGVARSVANLHAHADMLANYLNPRGVRTSHETPQILDTGGGLRQALPLLGTGPVFTLNSDAVWTGQNPLLQLAATWDPDRMDALLLLVRPEDAKGHTGAGDFHLGAEQTLVRGPGLIYSGAQIVKTDGLRDIPEQVFSLNRLWDRMIDKKRAFGLVHAGKWCDVGHPGGIAEAEALLRSADV